MAQFIPADTTLPIRPVSPTNGRHFQLAELYELLCCDLIETLQLGDGFVMVIDEEGKRAGKPRNERATHQAGFLSPAQLLAEWQRLQEAGVQVIWIGPPITESTSEADYIVGDTLICTGDEIR